MAGGAQRLRARLNVRLGWRGLAIACGFAGLMMASAGAAIFPVTVRLTAPIVCPAGTVESVVITRTSRTSKGSTSMTWNLVCIDREGGGKHIGAGHTFLLLIPLWTAFFLLLAYTRRGVRHLIARLRPRPAA